MNKSKTYILIVFFAAFFSLFLMQKVKAGVIFEDNFDLQDDWSPTPSGAVNDTSPAGASITCDYENSCVDVPVGWTGYKTSGWWWPPMYKNTVMINSDNYRGGSGKAFTFWNESNSGASGDGWGNDGMLSRVFDSDYEELYVRFWMKTKPGFEQDAVEDLQIKVFRIMHFDRSASMYSYGSLGESGPIMIWDFKNSRTYHIREAAAFRGDPQTINYYDPAIGDIQWSTNQIADPGEFADGEWHRYDYHVKTNTYSGGNFNADGVYEFWYDGILIRSLNNIQWKYAGSSDDIGWNTVAIGGNNYNHFDDNYGEQWYAIDDFMVSTTFMPEDYTIGGGSSDVIAPSLSPSSLILITKNIIPFFTFISSEAGTITYGGPCSSTTISAAAGENTITFNELSRGATYSDCTITVTDTSGNTSTPLQIPEFTITYSSDNDLDKDVDIFDYNILLTEFGKASVCQNQADANEDCEIDIFDYNSLLGDFGKSF